MLEGMLGMEAGSRVKRDDRGITNYDIRSVRIFNSRNLSWRIGRRWFRCWKPWEHKTRRKLRQLRRKIGWEFNVSLDALASQEVPSVFYSLRSSLTPNSSSVPTEIGRHWWKSECSWQKCWEEDWHDFNLSHQVFHIKSGTINGILLTLHYL